MNIRRMPIETGGRAMKPFRIALTTHRTGSARTRVAAALALLLSAAGTPAPAASPPALVVADVQVREVTEERRFVVHVRSTAAQPFDLVPSASGTVRVRLYGAQLGGQVEPTVATFGTITLAEEAGGHVLLRVDLAPAYRCQVAQGGSASVVELRIER